MPTYFAAHILGPDTHANRPAASAVPAGAVYSCTTDSKLEQSNGSAWSDYLTAGGGTITVQDEGSPLTTAGTTLNFTGAGVTASGTGATKTVNIPGGGGGGGGLSIPVVTQAVGSTNLNTTNPAVTIAAAASGQRLIVGVNLVGRGVTSITCTNVTFTSMFTATSAGSSHYEIWVGVVAGGSSGTTLTVNTGSSNFSTVMVLEVADALTPTASVNYSAGVTGTFGVFGPLNTATASRFIAAIVGCDNTTNAVMGWLTVPSYNWFRQASGTGLALMVGYAPTGSIGGLFTGASSAACYAIIGEIT